MKKTSLIKAVKTLYNKNTVLAIAESAKMHDNTVTITDLNIYLTIPYNSGINGCMPIVQWLAGLDVMENPSYSIEPKTRFITMSEGKQTIKVATDELDHFPVEPSRKNTGTFENVGVFDKTNFHMLLEGLDFVSNDSLRPGMTRVMVFETVAATDAHRLYFEPLPISFTKQILIPVKVIKLMDIIGGSWSVCAKEGKGVDFIELTNEESVRISFVNDNDMKFPDYKVVVPEITEETAVAKISTKELKQAIKVGSKFGNNSTKKGTLRLNGKTTWSTQNIDFGTEYEAEIPVEHNREIKISFNWDFIDKVLSKSPETVTMHYWGPNKAAIFENKYLIMPVMDMD